ncbi:hypothetical protein JKY72_02565 [Candidatus Gracilibacteria bacterium]|nr:hypothetical protein [Candidatus Gracilibacteria bacterium]
MTDSPYILQLKQRIRLLMSEKKFKEAFESAQELVTKHPDDKEFLALIQEVKEGAAKENNKLVEQKIKEVKPLIKENKYSEALVILKKLFSIAPNNPTLIKFYSKTQAQYQDYSKEIAEKFKVEKRASYDKLLAEDEDKLLFELFNLEKNSPGNQNVLSLTKEYRDKIIKKKLELKKDLIYSDKFDDIQNLISQLQKIDPTNPEVVELEKTINFRLHGSQIDNKKEFVYRSSKYLVTLMQLKKYEEAIKVALEILDVNHKDELVLKILEKAENKFFTQSRKLAIESVKSKQAALKADYEKNKETFVKI